VSYWLYEDNSPLSNNWQFGLFEGSDPGGDLCFDADETYVSPFYWSGTPLTTRPSSSRSYADVVYEIDGVEQGSFGAVWGGYSTTTSSWLYGLGYHFWNTGKIDVSSFNDGAAHSLTIKMYDVYGEYKVPYNRDEYCMRYYTFNGTTKKRGDLLESKTLKFKLCGYEDNDGDGFAADSPC
jgi:hypothetical protein